MPKDMKRLIRCFLLCSLLAGGCVKDPELDPAQIGEGDVWTTLDFAHTDYDPVSITTRSTLGPIAEARVSNLYVFLFNSAGERVYGHYFDRENKRATRDEVAAANTNCWMVNNRMDDTGTTTGTIRMKVPQLTGGILYLVSNLDTDMLNISPEKFSFIRTLDELKALTVLLNQEITSRNGSFAMTGSAENITITSSGITSATNQRVEIPLTRLDAKIEVRIRAAVGNETRVESQSGSTVEVLKDFTPDSWQVVNLPKGCFLLEHAVAAEGGHDADTGYFDSAPINFETETEETYSYETSDGTSETVTAPVYGFSFYMYENRPASKQTVTEYHQRDRRIKDDNTGAYDTTDGLWEYAPETSTYLVIKGEVSMNVNVDDDAKDQTLSASVIYYIHLGDIGRDVDDFRVKRNTHYTYTITVKGVKNIQVEVETGIENESGAMGHVYIAKESIYTFDAHYGQRVFAFDQEYITPKDVTWYVKTPFGREGMPEIIDGVEVPNGLDYKWVSFLVNDIETSEQYSRRNRTYNPDTVMDVMEFCNYIREQKVRFDNGRTNAFRKEIDEELRQRYPDHPEIYTRYRIYATVFVDEFYYDRDPISGEVRATLWKEFVNQPNRTMHILCDTQFSPDGDSSATGSVVTIRQRSIQSIFDPTTGDFQTAWGGEAIDETEGQLWFYNRTERHGTEAYNNENAGNTSRTNGLYNTARLWKLIDGNGGFTYKRWDDYLDFNRENDHAYLFLKDDDELATARYTCLMRNRDNNGNGIIDAAEVKWYIASIQQLSALYAGDQGISAEAQLYDKNNDYGKDDTDAYGTQLWRRHIISSTRWGTSDPVNYPTMLWAEEGLSTSAYQQYSTGENGKPGRYTVRCVRNLGMDPADEADAIVKLNDVNTLPEYSIIFETVQENYSTTSVYRFDVSRINKRSIRYYTTRELEPGNEYSESARLYSSFETGPAVSYTGTYQSLKQMIERGESPCPEGYRVPNIREASLMSNYITSDVNPNWWSGNYTLVNTYYSFGTLGKQYDTEISWYATSNHITISKPSEAKTIRCVRDVQ